MSKVRLTKEQKRMRKARISRSEETRFKCSGIGLLVIAFLIQEFIKGKD